MINFKRVFSVAVVAVGLSVASARADLVFYEHINGFNSGEVGAQVSLVSGLLGPVDFLGRYDVSGTIDNNPFGLLPGNIQVQDIGPAGDPENLGVSWDLTGTGFQLSAVLLKDGIHGATLWTATPEQAIASGSVQNIYWNTPDADRGSISHISFFGTSGNIQRVPDGGVTLLLLGTVCAGLGWMRRFLGR